MLEWQSSGYAPHLFEVKGTVLAFAYAGDNKRFLIQEIRTRVWDETDKRHYASTMYVVRDAVTVSDEDVRNGKQSQIVFRNDDYNKCEEYCKC